MKIGNTVPQEGRIFEWDIEEILTRHSADTSFFKGDYIESLFREEIDEAHSYGMSWGEIHDEIYDLEPTVAEVWEWMLDKKRDDEHYDDVLHSIRHNGFTRPLTASIEYDTDGSPYLKFGDGHHRLAAAIDLGMKSVPVEVFRNNCFANDSGDWRLGQKIPKVNRHRSF